MDMFIVSPKAVFQSSHYDLEATHKWGLPGVRCPFCRSTWAMTGLSFPSVDLSALPLATALEQSGVVKLDKFQLLRDLIIPLMPIKNFLPPPGTEFGPLQGKAFGPFGDFAWVGSWFLLLQRKTLEMIITSGVRTLSPCRTELIHKRKGLPELLELEIEPAIRLDSSCVPPELSPCKGCGRLGLKAPDVITVQKSSIPQKGDLFRVLELPTYIVAKERLAEIIVELKLTGLELTPVHSC